ncbi:LPXTG cell wall anchor domain-containing protein [Erysipelothrix sp. HDW6C]|uniref:LPXTG cell wall anchor domain-containing protein n=1 Tax=Erysipelothrix sp. HDW6C TaxID=2714930 RepID=UPI00140A4978|nr:LPXTG cell wall anchor domain-containing protein [Erysipelothrix sp. HDW6C]QIK69845.1 LPXTG cell wall anchor domain-containing protein [Erysipelothrix sp. HDW6C]
MKTKKTNRFLIFLVTALVIVQGAIPIFGNQERTQGDATVEKEPVAETSKNEESKEIETPAVTTDGQEDPVVNNDENEGGVTPAFEVTAVGLVLGDVGKPAGEPMGVATGAESKAWVVFSLLADESDVEPNQLAFRIEYPKGAIFNANSSDIYEYKIGGPNGPNDTSDGTQEYLWVTYKQSLSSGEAIRFNFDFIPFSKGVTDDGTELPMHVVAYDLHSGSTVSSQSQGKNSFTAIADKFNWENVRSTVSPTAIMTTIKTTTLNQMTFTESTRSLSGNTNGLVFAERVDFETKYNIPLGTDGYPLILVKPENLVDTSGIALVEGTDFVAEYTPDGYIKTFTVTKTIAATAGSELVNPSYSFRIIGAKVDPSYVIDNFDLALSESADFSITTESTNHRVTPSRSVSGTGKDAIVLPQSSNQTVKVTYTNVAELGDETLNQNFPKKITSVGGVGSSNTAESNLAAFKGDKVVFSFGENFRNLQDGSLTELRFTERANHEFGYQTDELQPLNIRTGVSRLENNTALQSTTLDVVIKYKDSSESRISLSTEELAKSKTIPVDPDSVANIDSITYIFKNVEPGFKLTTPPSIEYLVLEQADPTINGNKFMNTANMSYTYTNKDGDDFSFDKNSNTVSFYYKDRETDADGLYSHNKTGANLATGQRPVVGDSILFTITMTNDKANPVAVKSIVDNYTYNLSPYNGALGNVSNPDSKPIDESYLSTQNPNISNLVVWDPANNQEVLSDQSVVSMTNTDPVGKSYGKFDISFANDGIVLQPGETLKLTYTMSVNDEFKTNATIGNQFLSYDKNDVLLGTGEFWWSVPTPGLHNYIKDKSAVNANGNSVTELPYGSDVIMYTITIENTTNFIWDREIIVRDNYSANVSPVSGFGLIPDTFLENYRLNDAQPLNMAVAKLAGNMIMPEGFKEEEISVTLNNPYNEFSVSLGTNVLKPGESVKLNYTMQLRPNAEKNEVILNNFVVNMDGILLNTGRHKWQANSLIGKKGLVSVIKSVLPIETEGQVTPNTAALRDGDKIRYSVTVSNYHTRENHVVHFKNVVDQLGDNLVFVPGTLKIEQIESKDNDINKVVTPIDESKYAVDYDEVENQLSVRFNDAQQLFGGLVKINGKEEVHYRYVISYDVAVDTQSDKFEKIPVNQPIVTRSNNVDVFYIEPISELVFKSGGKLEADVNDLDNDPSTESYLNSVANVKVINEYALFGNISKSVDRPIVDVVSSDNLVRNYTVQIENYSFVKLKAHQVVDLLPHYETIDPAIGVKVIDSKGDSYDAVYAVDSVKLGETTYGRLTVKGYKVGNTVLPLEVDGSTEYNKASLMKITYTTKVDGVSAYESMIATDNPEVSDANRVAMYLADDATMLIRSTNAALASYMTNDDVVETDWDSNLNTKNRYQNQVVVKNIASAISPYVKAKAQIARQVGAGESYVDYVQGTSAVEPGDIVAWNITFGNANQANTPEILANSEISVVLPQGITYLGFAKDTNGDIQTPSYLTNERVIKNAANETVVSWTVTDAMPANKRLAFTIRTATNQNNYATYGARAYFAPNATPKQIFFDSKVKKSSEYVSYKFETDTRDISALNENLAGESHFVYSDTQLDVYGTIGISTVLLETEVETGNTVSSRGLSRTLQMADRVNTLRYDMRVNVDKSDSNIHSIVMINRLPKIGDTMTVQNKPRNSQVDSVLAGDGDFNVALYNVKTGAFIENVDPAMYQIQYSVAAVDYQFTANDWKGEDTNAQWMTHDELIAAGINPDNVTAVRAVMDKTFNIVNGQSLSVKFSVVLKDYNISNLEVNDSFGYRVTIGNGISVNSEPLPVSATAKVIKDRVNLVVNVESTETEPTITSFDVDVIEFDGDNVEVARNTHTLNVAKLSEGNWSNNEWIYNLPVGHRYEIRAHEYEDFEIPTTTITKVVDRDNTTEWTLTANYVQKIYDIVDVNVTVNSLDANTRIASVTPTVNTINGAGNTIDESAHQMMLDDTQNASLEINKLVTGNSYTLTPSDLNGYTVAVGEVKQEALANGGIRWTLSLVYTEKDPKNPVKPITPEKPNPLLPSTGVESGYLVAIGAGIILVGLAFVVITKRKKKQ